MGSGKRSVNVGSGNVNGARGLPGRLQGRIGPHPLWAGLFALWAIFLTGGLAPWLQSPGVIQLLRLKHLADEKKTQTTQAENELIRLQEQSVGLEKSHVAQQREIRRVLGYIAPGEIVFDFTSTAPPR